MAGLAVLVLTDADLLLLVGVVAFVLGSAETLFDNSAQSILPSIIERDSLETRERPPLRGRGRHQPVRRASARRVPVRGRRRGAVPPRRRVVRPRRARHARGTRLVPARPRGRPADQPKPSIRGGHRGRACGGSGATRCSAPSRIALGVINMLDAGDPRGPGALRARGPRSLEDRLRDPADRRWDRRAGGQPPRPGVSAKIGAGTVIILAASSSASRRSSPALWANPIAVGVSFAVIGAVGVGWNVVTVSLRQAIVPDELLGRVNGAYRLFGLGSMPIGALLGGVLARDVRAAGAVLRRRRRLHPGRLRHDPVGQQPSRRRGTRRRDLTVRSASGRGTIIEW